MGRSIETKTHCLGQLYRNVYEHRISDGRQLRVVSQVVLVFVFVVSPSVLKYLNKTSLH